MAAILFCRHRPAGMNLHVIYTTTLGSQGKVSLIVLSVICLVLLAPLFSYAVRCGPPSFTKTNEMLEGLCRDPKAGRDQWTKVINSFLEIHRSGKDRGVANQSLFLAGRASLKLYLRSGKNEDLEQAIRCLYEYTRITRNGPRRIMGLKELKAAHLLKRKIGNISQGKPAPAAPSQIAARPSGPTSACKNHQIARASPDLRDQSLSRWASAAKAPPALSPHGPTGNPYCSPEAARLAAQAPPSAPNSNKGVFDKFVPQPPLLVKENASSLASVQSSGEKIPPCPHLEKGGKQAMPVPPLYKGGSGGILAKQVTADSQRSPSVPRVTERLPCPPEPPAPPISKDSTTGVKIASISPSMAVDRAPVVRRIENLPKEFVIVLDPGHGGKDPGAVSGDGRIKEKDICLEVAYRVKKGLSGKYPGIKVDMTRADDTFLTLQERTARANSLNADLFISLHCNADLDSSSRGVETFYLSKASSPRAMRMAARENGIPLATMSDLQATLLDLMLTSKKSESDKLAKTVHNCLIRNLAKTAPRIRDRGIKRAPFYVLLGAKMPAILVECAFISNGREEQKLKSARYLDSVAQGIATGAATYLRELGDKS